MIATLVGHPGSQGIVPVSKFLSRKYLINFDTMYLNYKGGINGWAEYVAGFLKYLPDPFVLFALDDYLIADHIDIEMFVTAQLEFRDENVVCVKLCKSTEEEHAEYPVTTQYCIWNREFLIWLLEQVHTPWQFELDGSKIFNQTGKKSLHIPCIDYFTNSALSSRWEGIRLDGLKEEDILTLKANGLI